MATKTRHFPLRFYELFFFPFSYHFFKLERQIETEYRDISFHDKFGFFFISKLHFCFRHLLKIFCGCLFTFWKFAFGYSSSSCGREGSVYILRKLQFFFIGRFFSFNLFRFFFSRYSFFRKVIRQVFFSSSASFQDKLSLTLVPVKN